jgi:glucosamine--fructose-6-phosphate aminotransferase (isomerizing)
MAGDEALAAELRAVPDAMARQLERPVDAGLAAGWDRCVVAGRGANYATAFEAALKIKELTGIAAEPFSPADLMHGPVAVLGPDHGLLAVAPSGPTLAGAREAAAAARSRGAPVVAITDRASELEAAGAAVLEMETVPEWLSPLVAVLPAQLLAVGLAEARGVDVDRPFGLNKVTETS